MNTVPASAAARRILGDAGADAVLMADASTADLLHKVALLLLADLVPATLVQIESAETFDALPEAQRTAFLPQGCRAWGVGSVPRGVKAVRGTAREIYQQIRADLNLGAPNLNVG